MKKISLISGGSGGLGLEIADVLVKSGKSVMILGRDKNKLSNALKHLNNNNTANNIESMICNVGIEDNIQEVISFLNNKNYIVEYLYNNAGRGLFAKAETTTLDMIEKVFEANLKGMILLTSAILRITPKDEELTIVNIMSTSSHWGRPEETIYCAAKWGARGYTEALRAELAGKKRNIIAVYPGAMKTGFWEMPGHNRDISIYMDPAEVASKVVNAVTVEDKFIVSDIMISRKK